jgi:hypothetical protein
MLEMRLRNENSRLFPVRKIWFVVIMLFKRAGVEFLRRRFSDLARFSASYRNEPTHVTIFTIKEPSALGNVSRQGSKKPIENVKPSADHGPG